MNWLKKQLSKEVWSPYVAGILLGLVGILAVLLSKSLLMEMPGKTNDYHIGFPNCLMNFMLPILTRKKPFLHEPGVHTVLHQAQIQIPHDLFVRGCVVEENFERALHFRH